MEQQREPSVAPADAVPARASGARRRHGARRSALERARVGDPGLALLGSSVALAIAVGVALTIGWPALLFVVALMQVFLARSWVDYLEVPGATVSTIGVLVLGLAADAGVVIARLTLDSGEDADGLLQLAPALGVVFLVAVLSQLARRDGRDGALAGLLATATGGVLMVGLAAWLPLQASAAGDDWVVFGFGACVLVGAGVGVGAWFRRIQVPSGALLLPLLAAALSGPLYVAARIVAG